MPINIYIYVSINSLNIHLKSSQWIKYIVFYYEKYIDYLLKADKAEIPKKDNNELKSIVIVIDNKKSDITKTKVSQTDWKRNCNQWRKLMNIEVTTMR